MLACRSSYYCFQFSEQVRIIFVVDDVFFIMAACRVWEFINFIKGIWVNGLNMINLIDFELFAK